MGACNTKKQQVASKLSKQQLECKQKQFYQNLQRKMLVIQNELRRRPTIISLEDITKNYIFDPVILGQGSFGKVRKACLRSNRQLQYAVKTMPKKLFVNKIHTLKRELEILKSLDHPNIVKFFEVYEDEKYYHFVMEFCNGGSLYQKIQEKQKRNQHFSEKSAAKIMKQLLSAIYYLHEHGICHRDLKPENILFAHTNSSSEIKIIDFGLAKILNNQYDFYQQNSNLQTFVGTSFYLPPEVLKGKYNNLCDI